MLMYKCCNCREVFHPMDVAHYREDYGEVSSACPFCFGDYEEVLVCSECGAIMDEDFDRWEDVCPECGEVITNGC